MEELERNFEELDSKSRERTLYFFVLLYPDYEKMDYEDRWYAEWDKLMIADNLSNMNLRYRRIMHRGYTLDRTKAVKEAFHGTLTDYYDSFLTEGAWDFISDNLTDIHKKYIDRKFYCMYNSEDFFPEIELTNIIDQVKENNKAKSIGTVEQPC